MSTSRLQIFLFFSQNVHLHLLVATIWGLCQLAAGESLLATGHTWRLTMWMEQQSTSCFDWWWQPLRKESRRSQTKERKRRIWKATKQECAVAKLQVSRLASIQLGTGIKKKESRRYPCTSFLAVFFARPFFLLHLAITLPSLWRGSRTRPPSSTPLRSGAGQREQTIPSSRLPLRNTIARHRDQPPHRLLLSFMRQFQKVHHISACHEWLAWISSASFLNLPATQLFSKLNSWRL